MEQQPTLKICRTTVDGRPVVDLIVRHATPKLRDLLDELEYKIVPDIANMRRKRCVTPAEVDAARAPLIPLVIGEPVDGVVMLRGE